MSLIHVRSTTRGSGNNFIRPSDFSTDNGWKLRQLLLHCAVTFTTVCTFSVRLNSHEGTAYDTLILSSTLATDAGVLQDLAWYPEPAAIFTGKDRLTLVMDSASAAMTWAYDAVIEV